MMVEFFASENWFTAFADTGMAMPTSSTALAIDDANFNGVGRVVF